MHIFLNTCMVNNKMGCCSSNNTATSELPYIEKTLIHKVKLLNLENKKLDEVVKAFKMRSKRKHVPRKNIN